MTQRDAELSGMTVEQIDNLVMTYAKAADVIGCERGSHLYDEITRGLEAVFMRMQLWSPIETAPKDRFILVWCPEDNSRWLAKWQGERWYGVDESGLTREGMGPEDVTGWKVEAWMEIPPAPHLLLSRAFRCFTSWCRPGRRCVLCRHKD
jgi:hypothetical protein